MDSRKNEIKDIESKIKKKEIEISKLKALLKIISINDDLPF